jgi:hypothetical protein
MTLRRATTSRVRQEISLAIASTFEDSSHIWAFASIMKGDPNELPNEKKELFRIELCINKTWMPRNDVYFDRDTGADDDTVKLGIAQQVTDGLISSEAILKNGTKCALHFSLIHPNHMKRVNGFTGILVSALILKTETDLFRNKSLKQLDYDVWLTMDWSSGLRHIRVKNWGPTKQIPYGTKIYVNIFYPSNVFYKKMRCHFVVRKNGGILCAPNHAMSVRSQDIAIGDVWLEITFLGPDKELKIERLDWNPPPPKSIVGNLELTDPSAAVTVTAPAAVAVAVADLTLKWSISAENKVCLSRERGSVQSHSSVTSKLWY